MLTVSAPVQNQSIGPLLLGESADIHCGNVPTGALIIVCYATDPFAVLDVTDNAGNSYSEPFGNYFFAGDQQQGPNGIGPWCASGGSPLVVTIANNAVSSVVADVSVVVITSDVGTLCDAGFTSDALAFIQPSGLVNPITANSADGGRPPSAVPQLLLSFLVQGPTGFGQDPFTTDAFTVLVKRSPLSGTGSIGYAIATLDVLSTADFSSTWAAPGGDTLSQLVVFGIVDGGPSPVSVSRLASQGVG